jgi:thiamine pyrophosphate-dependent acetolactate synthase large subunit-like protein
MVDIVIYENGTVALNAQVENETIWLSQKQMAELFGVNVPAVSKHMRNIFKSKELIEKSVVSKMEITASDGKTYKTKHYNLDAIISIGYRLNSKQATQFRIWATNILREHMLQGYTINQERIQKNYDSFLRVVEDIKVLSQNADNVRAEDVLELIKAFSATWFGLDSYDREELPKEGITKVNLEYEVEKLYDDIAIFKQELMNRGEAAEIFATEKTQRSLEGIVGNVFQSK